MKLLYKAIFFRRTTIYEEFYTILSRSKQERYPNKKRKVLNGGEHNPESCKREIYDIDILNLRSDVEKQRLALIATNINYSMNKICDKTSKFL